MVNFHVIEGEYNEDEVYAKFKELYMNSDKTINEIIVEQGLTRYMYVKLRRRVTEETGYQRPHSGGGFKDYESRYIRQNISGNWAVQKNIKGKSYACGTYPSFETACDVRDILELNNWDLSLLPSLKEQFKKVSV